MTDRVRLFHWNAAEARARAGELAAAGYRVVSEGLTPPPDAFVIDLTRLPSHGREVAIHLRGRKATRHVPLIFAGGEPEKIERIRAVLPDAVYTPWSRIRSALKSALAHPTTAPAVPLGMMQRYAATPLVKKLGLKPGSTLALLNAPRGFDATLGALPEGAVLQEGFGARFDVAVWFVRSVDELRRGIASLAVRLGPARLWIAWPKRASGVRSGLTQQLIRETGLDLGLVDYKICSIDATWSGLAFVRRRAAPPVAAT